MPDMVNILFYYSITPSTCPVPELRKDIEYETDENIPSCCLAMCLDWFLQKLRCRGTKDGEHWQGSGEILGNITIIFQLKIH